MKHHEFCDTQDKNPDGIKKPCNCNGREDAAYTLNETEKPKTDEAPAESVLMKLLAQKYSELRPCVVEGSDEENFTVWLKVGVQSFCITRYAGNREESEFMQRMIGKALEAVLKVECHHVHTHGEPLTMS